MARKFVIAAGLVLIPLIALAARQSAGSAAVGVDAAPTTPSTTPLVQLVGHESKVREREFVLVKTEAEWTALWARHSGTAAGAGALQRHAAPKIDFTRCMVVGCFGGATTNTDGEVALSVSKGKDGVTVRFESSTFQTFSTGKDKGQATTPFGLWVIVRAEGTVTLEQARRGGKGAEVTLTKVHQWN